MQQWKVQLLSRLWGMWHYRLWGLVAAWTVFVCGWLVVQALPNKYESAATVYIDTDTLIRPLMAGLTVNPDVNQEVDVMMKSLITRPSIEQVVKLSDPSMAGASRDALADRVTQVQKNIALRPLETKNLFSISYTDNDPAYARAVTQSLVTLLVNSNLGTQRRNVDGVQGFLDQQIAKYEAQLRDMEKRRADFRTAHLEYYSSTSPDGDPADLIDKAHAETVDAQNQLMIESAKRDSLAAQLRHVSATMRVDAPPPLVINSGEQGQTSNLAQAIAVLANLQSRFTDNHPDVIAQKKLVERLKAQQSGGRGADAAYQGHQGVPNPVYISLQGKLADASTNAALQKRRLELALANEQKARTDMAEAVTVSRQYSDLDRDYAVIHKNYLDLVARREAARLSQAVGEQESDTAFRVIEPPRTPEIPVSPNRLLLNTLVLFVGIAAGFALTFILHANQNSFSVGDQLQEAFDLPLLGTVSLANAPGYQVQVRQAVMAMAASMAVMLLLYGLLAVGSYTNAIAKLRGFL